MKIIKRAGLIPWVKPFQNLRSTRETELMEIYPSHVVVSWIGHSEKVARQHYLQTTDAHFERAVANLVGHQVGHKGAKLQKQANPKTNKPAKNLVFYAGLRMRSQQIVTP